MNIFSCVYIEQVFDEVPKQRVANDESLIKLVFSRKAFIFVLNVLCFLHSFSLFLSPSLSFSSGSRKETYT